MSNPFHVFLRVANVDRADLKTAGAKLVTWLKAQGMYVFTPPRVVTQTVGTVDSTEVEIRGLELDTAEKSTALQGKVVDALAAIVAKGGQCSAASVYTLGTEHSIFDEHDDLRYRGDGTPPNPPMSQQLATATATVRDLTTQLAAATSNLTTLQASSLASASQIRTLETDRDAARNGRDAAQQQALTAERAHGEYSAKVDALVAKLREWNTSGATFEAELEALAPTEEPSK